MGVTLKGLSICFVAVYLSQVVHGTNLSFKWFRTSDTLNHPFIGEDRRDSVSQIFRKDYSLTPEDKQNVERHISSIPQLVSSGRKMLTSTSENVELTEGKKELMWEDWNYLRNELHKCFGLTKFSIWIFHERRFSFELSKLKQLHEFMDKYFPMLKSQASISEQDYEEIKKKSKKYIGALLSLLCYMRPDFQYISPDSRFLYLQRIVFETVHYFYKHNLIDTTNLGSLFNEFHTMGDISRYIFQSYKFIQQGNNKLLPLSSKNVLNYWHYFPFMDMLEGLGEEYKEKFSTEHIKIGFAHNISPIHKQNKEIRDQIIFFQLTLLDKDYVMKNLRGGNHQLYYKDVYEELQDDALEEAIQMFTNFHTTREPEKYHVELEHLFQIIENQKDYQRARFSRLPGPGNGFEEKFDLMSSGGQIRANIERMQIYIHNNFKKFEWPFPFSYSQRNIEVSKKNIEEIRILAKHLKMLESEYLENKKPISPDEPLYIYSQHKIITDKINDIKEDIINSTKYYEKYLSSSLKISPAYWLETVTNWFKEKVN
ncbi:hypothetical protein PGT21_025591 [Puccinia graminis f. sp. tritici]|uniref:Uncharacterized protein n=2 Tax=Puccinia graminis f. sp. tritici TaxID=56615 RepID=A0A5B0R5Z4_PUCGR|nr:hypothetical protein PGT21_025591 [Puccinia graminis f. sp. tritici]KAA1120940.1 hypothetical protein PGTUg99_021219 [Puccinia graminis f. sp. tritici]